SLEQLARFSKSTFRQNNIHPQKGTNVSNLQSLCLQGRVGDLSSGGLNLLTVEAVGMELAVEERVLLSVEGDGRRAGTFPNSGGCNGAAGQKGKDGGNGKLHSGVGLTTVEY